ncbi:MAG: hypothetical protein K0R25_956 [Rickettsiaceae bacterium]|jgi:lysophospholipase L1-like esterase|nr:hypothetical protein [Rickettsiaceae bacterium]
MSKSFFEKNPKIATFIFSSIIVAAFAALLAVILKINFLQDYEGGEKYSILDKAIYQIRCNGERNIRLRELNPNRDYVRIPDGKFETLEDKKYILRSDKDGMVKPSFIHKNPDLQIFFLGGSTTECETVDEEFRFPYLTGRLLEEKLKAKINSDNAARSGNNSLHSINILINKILPYNPDIVVMMHSINDLTSLFYEGSYWNDNKTIAPISCAKKHSDSKKNYDQWEGSNWQQKVVNDKAEQDKLVKMFKENLKIFINVSRAKNITPVLMTQANRVENKPDFTSGRGLQTDIVYKKLYTRFNQTIRDIGKAENILVIDLARKIPSDKKYIYDPVHLNKAGSVMAAEEIAEKLSIYITQHKLLKK